MAHRFLNLVAEQILRDVARRCHERDVLEGSVTEQNAVGMLAVAAGHVSLFGMRSMLRGSRTVVTQELVGRPDRRPSIVDVRDACCEVAAAAEQVIAALPTEDDAGRGGRVSEAVRIVDAEYAVHGMPGPFAVAVAINRVQLAFAVMAAGRPAEFAERGRDVSLQALAAAIALGSRPDVPVGPS